jgi:hypothetical protein
MSGNPTTNERERELFLEEVDAVDDLSRVRYMGVLLRGMRM